MKSITVKGQTISGKNFGELKAKIKAMGLKGKELDQAMSAANAAFPKKNAAGSSKRSGTRSAKTQPRGYPGTQSEVTTTRLENNGIKLQVLTGPSKAVLKEVRGNKNARNVVHAEIQTHVVGKDAQATIVLLEGNVDRAKAGSVSKDMLAPYVNQPGFSRLSGVKAIKAFGQYGYAPIGENLNKENVRRFVQALVAATYDGAALRGAKMGTEIISTNIFLATDAKVRMMAWWPANRPGNYGVLALAVKDGAPSPSLSYLGTYGLFGIAADGQSFIASFEDAIKAAAVAQVENKIATMPWKDLALKLDKMGAGTFEASVASSIKDETGKTTGYTVFLTTRGHLAIVEFAQKDATITAKVKDTVPFQSDMALLGFANDGATAVTANLNGGPNLFGFQPIESLGIKAEHLPAGIVAAQQVRTERIAAKQALRQ